MPDIHHIDSIHLLHQVAGGPPPRHPLFSVHRLEELSNDGPGFPQYLTYGFYAVGLKKNLSGYLKYGRTSYDFQEGALGFTAPLQVLSFELEILKRATGWMLFFQQELLAGSALANTIRDYGFFDYQVNEGLHLSQEEENTLDIIFGNIQTEYQRPIDQYSKQVVLSNIELLLTYAQRYYSRQFILRNDISSSVLNTFESKLHQCLDHAEVLQSGLPSVNYFADQLHLSPKYLSDLLKSLTGKTTQEHIHYQLIEKAKVKLLASDAPVADIAYALGFEYPQYFSRLFKQKTGMSPTTFRLPDN